jgi:hypothetical protein
MRKSSSCVFDRCVDLPANVCETVTRILVLKSSLFQRTSINEAINIDDDDGDGGDGDDVDDSDGDDVVDATSQRFATSFVRCRVKKSDFPPQK